MKTKTTTENGFKKTEIGLIPSDWEVKGLSEEDVTNLVMGQSPPSSTYNSEGKGLPFLQGKTDFGRVFPTPTQWCTQPSRIAEKEDILMSVRAPVGDVNIAPYKCAIGRGLAAIRPKQKVSGRFLFQYLTFAKERIESHGTGSIFKSINKSILQNFQIAVPESSEQQKISFVLSKIQYAIEQQEQIIEIAKDLRKSLINKLFTKGLHGEKQKETEIGFIPKSWEIRTVNDVSDKLIGGGTPSTGIPDYWGGNIKWTTSKRLGDEIYLYDGEKRISQKGLDNSSTNLILKNNLLISTRVTVGKSVVNKVDITISQDLTGAFINKEKHSPEFIAYQLKTNRIQRIFEEQKRGATIKGITREDLKKIQLAIPDIEEQKEIANVLLNVDKKLSQSESRKATLQHLFKTMLNQLMTGRVRVKDLDIQVN